ncbi:uncharacterized protein LOC114312294 isoform X1 [Camellia sinensis]|uniref:uncharacterized protein LOC114312294 isoform X1 n=1 Tax=Camellia sinensis TaxID=4442 RepID=UPI001036DE60|nr:uncharacterized protein LOC114312294 isoform X1 [Camellia sinensis]XP_028114303.1 uncharacterized protein LOC114312294 isoform X1 [Camellia sinensis]XP_028114304.1 uncharacterized protein LOC114312294 isoform X1 [Camellia sinensis]XP_028114305.1 uncharacterized protein LOC114312294 isoform X1 [Camellia sinensis]XP_028114306.1 uncharacterized protein LOC114312294 isoform X1 [Camellia sinensis]XP_028114307.1 uncharacterized protein LOC114312294 isoform X1 [Camellia sinensis]XP_028114308.1 un
MEIDNPIESNGSTAGVKENGLRLYPVSATDSGEGLPYAPEDWPNPGDVWSWKVGKRVAHSGCFLDRYLYLPKRLQEPMRKRGGFASKLSVEHFVRASFPGADVDAFFASFSWKIPAKKLHVNKGSEEELNAVITLLPEEISEQLGSDSQFGAVGCKAGNKICNSLVETRDSALEPMACDICCSEPSFCRDCCCILCCKTINSSYGGYSFIKCEAMVGYNIICGHVAHIDCALRSYMAGTVGGSIGLDAEYYCRRCDMRTDLVPHVTKIFRTCESIDSRDDIEKILNVGSCVLRGSQKTSAKSLLLRIEMAMAKLKSGTYLENIWKTEDISAVTAGGLSDRGHNALEVTNRRESLEFGIGSPQILSTNFDPRIESLKLEDEIDRVLHSLRKAQESEYKIAEERLCAQKNYILNLYQQLDKERFEHSTHSSSNDPDALLEATRNREDRIKWEIIKLREMEEVGKGFGKTSKNILKEHFGLQTEH